MCILEINKAPIALDKKAIEPTDISMLAVIITKARPEAITNKGAALSKTEKIVVIEKKLFAAIAKYTITATITNRKP